VVATATDGRTLASVGTGDGKALEDSDVHEGAGVTVDRDGDGRPGTPPVIIIAPAAAPW
jgi:hypothetical protein